MFFSNLNILQYFKRKILHHIFLFRIFSVIPLNGYKYISKKSLFDFFNRIDEISIGIKEYHEQALEVFFVEEQIPPKERKIELHTICLSIYDMKGAHHDTIEHLTNVREIATQVSRYMSSSSQYRNDLDDQTIEIYSMAAFMHDISKIIIDDGLLYDGRRFNAQERMFINIHPLISVIMIEYIKNRNKHLSEYLDAMNVSIIEHHERGDGSGYPAGKTFEETSLGGRILSVSDVFDAMRAKKRKYKKPLDVQEAVKELLARNDLYEEGIVRALQVYIITHALEVESMETLLEQDIFQEQEEKNVRM